MNKKTIENNATVNEILSKIEQELRREFHDKIKKLILFGSYARGDFDSESDMDILVLVDDSDLNKFHEARVNLAQDILLNYGILVSIIFQTEKHFDDYYHTIPFFKNIVKEGIPFYG